MRRQLVPETTLNPQASDYRRLGLILLVALIHGLIYLFLVPPWQHYDEPNHFEYVWLTARGLGDALPTSEDFHPRLNLRVIESMHRHGFYNGLAVPPMPVLNDNLRLPGYTQLGEPPLYYILAGLPGRLLPPMAVERQLYAARLVSVFLYLLTVLSGWGVARTLTLSDQPLRWLAPTLLALLPGLAELMSAVNNDALAIAAFSLFFWGSVRLLERGLNLLDLVWVLAAAGLTWFSKNTAAPALALLPVVLLFALLRGRLRPLAWALLIGGIAAVLIFGLAADDAAGWYRATSQPAGLRILSGETVQGSAALALDPQAKVIPGWSPPVYQILSPAVARPAFDQTVTLGVWMWAERARDARSPRLIAGSGVFSETVALTTTPQFYAFHAALPPGSDRIWVELDPGGSNAGRVYYDAAVLSIGEFPLDAAPQFSDGALLAGVWGEQPFANMLRNPSFERPGLRVASWLDDRLTGWLPDNARPSQVLAAFIDPAGAGYYLRTVGIHLFKTFWAQFGWGHVPLAWSWGYAIPLAISVLALLGLLTGALRLGRELPGAVVAVAALALAAAFLLALMRGTVYLAQPGYYYSSARHAYPAIVPAALGLSAGWLGLPGGRRLMPVLLALLVALDLLSFYTVAVYYGHIFVGGL